MNHAQMEAFQYLLEICNLEASTAQISFNKQLVFKYNDNLWTGSFYKQSKSSLKIESLQEQVTVENYHYFEDKPLESTHLLKSLTSSSNQTEFASQYLGKMNLERPELIFLEIRDFVENMEGNPVNTFIYDLKELDGNLQLPFISTYPDSVFEPVSLINT